VPKTVPQRLEETHCAMMESMVSVRFTANNCAVSVVSVWPLKLKLVSNLCRFPYCVLNPSDCDVAEHWNWDALLLYDLLL
jgi:hypothetical protein